MTTATATRAAVCPAHAALDDVPAGRAPSPRELDQTPAASGVNAEGLGLADRLGTLEPDKLADLIVVQGDIRSRPWSWWAWASP